jgi:sterol 3beta-glucosyltransferase
VRIALVCSGTRGDVQPFVILARALADKGHDVQLIAPSNAAEMARAAEVSFCALPFDFQALIRAETAQRMLAAGRAIEFFRWLGEQEKDHREDTNRTLISATESADMLVFNLVADAKCRAIAEARQIRMAPVHLQPHVLSWTYPSVWLGWRSLGPALNRVSHELTYQLAWRAQREGLTALHRELGLASPTSSTVRPIIRGKLPTLLAYSQALCPVPASWPATMHPVGPLKLSPALRARLGETGITAELETWLQAGPRPVFLGFGSMPILDKRAMLRTIRTSLLALGLRGIVAAGWSDLNGHDTASDETLILVGDVDHESVLPRCRAAVHHGGAGTIAASVGAGLPTLVCSVFADQRFWGERCRKLGVGDTFPFAKLDLRRLTKGLEAVLDPQIAKRARKLASRIAGEDGVRAALAHLDGDTAALR